METVRKCNEQIRHWDEQYEQEQKERERQVNHLEDLLR